MNPERTFLHDLSNPLSVALGMVELALESLRQQPTEAVAAEVVRLEKCHKSLTRMADLIRERRKLLIASE